MRVAVVAEWYPSPADPVHGIWAHRQAVAAHELGVEVQVLALRRPVPPLAVARRLLRLPPDLRTLRRWAAGARRSLRVATLDALAIQPVPWFGPPRPISYGSWGYWMGAPLGRALDRLYEAWPFDVLHAHCLAPVGHAGARWAGRRPSSQRPAFVVSAHGPDMIQVPQRSRVGRQACRVALHEADRVLANSRWAKRRCEELAGGSLPVSVVHLGATVAPPGTQEGEPVRPAVQGASAARHRAPAATTERQAAPGASTARRAEPKSERNGELKLVTVAHLQARKRHDVVLRALARLDPACRPRYLVIGDGEQRYSLERLAQELGVRKQVRFLGQLPNDRAVAEMAGCDVFVMPGVEEPFGVAFVEAMAAGLPAVGGRGEGGPEDIAAAGEGMLLVAPGDVGELAWTLERLCADRAELRRLGAAARATARANFTWERCGEKTVAAYQEAMAAARRRR